MLADELDRYKGKDNKYVKENIQEIQELYKSLGLDKRTNSCIRVNTRKLNEELFTK